MSGKPSRLIVSCRCTRAIIRLFRSRSSRCSRRSRLASSIFCWMTGCTIENMKKSHRISAMLIVASSLTPFEGTGVDRTSPRVGHALARPVAEHGGGGERCLVEPRRALTAVTAHGLERRATDDLHELVGGLQLAGEAAGRAHRRLHGVAHLPGTERTPLHARDDALPNGDAHGARG